MPSVDRSLSIFYAGVQFGRYIVFRNHMSLATDPIYRLPRWWSHCHPHASQDTFQNHKIFLFPRFHPDEWVDLAHLLALFQKTVLQNKNTIKLSDFLNVRRFKRLDSLEKVSKIFEQFFCMQIYFMQENTSFPLFHQLQFTFLENKDTQVSFQCSLKAKLFLLGLSDPYFLRLPANLCGIYEWHQSIINECDAQDFMHYMALVMAAENDDNLLHIDGYFGVALQNSLISDLTKEKDFSKWVRFAKKLQLHGWVERPEPAQFLLPDKEASFIFKLSDRAQQRVGMPLPYTNDLKKVLVNDFFETTHPRHTQEDLSRIQEIEASPDQHVEISAGRVYFWPYMFLDLCHLSKKPAWLKKAFKSLQWEKTDYLLFLESLHRSDHKEKLLDFWEENVVRQQWKPESEEPPTKIQNAAPERMAAPQKAKESDFLRLKTLAEEELHHLISKNRKAYQKLKLDFLASLPKERQKLYKSLAERMRPELFDQQIKAGLLEFMVQNPADWQSEMA